MLNQAVVANEVKPDRYEEGVLIDFANATTCQNCWSINANPYCNSFRQPLRY